MRRQAHLRAAAVIGACATLAGCGSSSSEVSDTGGSTAPSSSAPAGVVPTDSTPSQAPTPPPATAAPSSTGTTSTSSQTGGTPTGGGGSPNSARQTCGSVAFAPASSHGAFEIRATGTGCSTAQGVASVAKSCFGCDYRAAAFSCHGRKITTGLIRVAYTCINGAARISFVRG